MSFVPASRIADAVAFLHSPATAAAIDIDLLVDCGWLAGRKTHDGLSPRNPECA